VLKISHTVTQASAGW